MQSRNNGSCTSPTTAVQQHQQHHHQQQLLQRSGRPTGIYGVDGSLASQSSADRGSNFNSNYNSNSGSAAAAAGGAASPSSLAVTGGGGAGAAAAAAMQQRTKPEAVRRSKSQGAATHRYRDRLVRTLAFNSSLPVHHSSDESPTSLAGATTSSVSSSSLHHVDHAVNGSYKMTDESATQPSPLQHCRRNLLLLHRHQSAFTSLGTNVTFANPKKTNKSIN